MILIKAFIFCGFLSMLSMLVLDNTKLTPGHVNTLLVILGVILSFFGVYEKLINYFSVGATLPITNFGHVLYQSCFEGFLYNGFNGLINNVLTNSSAVLSISCITALVVSILFKSKN